MNCNICSTSMRMVYTSPKDKSLTSLGKIISQSFTSWVCEECGHVKKSTIDNEQEYYAKNYNLLIESEDEDQICVGADGEKYYRLDYQAKLVKDFVDIKNHQKVLDYGSAKAMTLKKVFDSNKTIIPYCYDVGESYQTYWGFLPKENTSVGNSVPIEWYNKMDHIVSFFCLEHIEELMKSVAEIANCLKLGGTFFTILPNALSNVADFIVVDHTNHFFESSIRYMLSKVGLKLDLISSSDYAGAWIVKATKVSSEPIALPMSFSFDHLYQVEKAFSYWNSIGKKIGEIEAIIKDKPYAIYGAGFYGTYLFSHMHIKPVQFLDQNHFLHGKKVLNTLVTAPDDCPIYIKDIVVGLNPEIAPQVIKGVMCFNDKKINFHFI